VNKESSVHSMASLGRVETLPLGETHSFSPIFLDYLAGEEALGSFYCCRPEVASVPKVIQQKKLTETARQTLQAAIQRQYGALKLAPALAQNIRLLSQPTTFTVTTGHQLNIFSGPMYFIYKIVTVVKACQQLKKLYPAHDFVPVYWMASEDHDVAEINHTWIEHQKITWNTPQTGPVGRFSLEGFEAVINAIPGSAEPFATAYREAKNLADATRQFVNALFAEYGLLVVDGDDSTLKAQFSSVILDDLRTHRANDFVNEASGQLDALGYKSQIFPREINFFYMEDGLRARIVKENDTYHILGTDTYFDEVEMEHMVRDFPERFSPNVVMRPLYQETILPNIAYVGGPAEVAYWLQLKGVFDHYQVPFPLVMPRNFGLVVQEPVARKMKKVPLNLTDWFLPTDALATQFARTHSEHPLELASQQQKIERLFASIKTQAAAIDSTLEAMVLAQRKKALNSLQAIEKKMLRAEKRYLSDKIRQIQEVKQSLFPGGGLQERKWNVLPFLWTNPQLIPQLVEHMDAFQFQMYVFFEEK
jgi:bacillithiol synthase